MKTIKIIISTIKTYILRLLFALVNRDFNRPMKLTKEESLYSFLEENKKRIQYLMYQKNNSSITDIKTIKEMEKYNEELKEALDLHGNRYNYRRPLWVSSKMKNFLKKDEADKVKAYEKHKTDMKELDEAFQELQERLRNKKIKTTE